VLYDVCVISGKAVCKTYNTQGFSKESPFFMHIEMKKMKTNKMEMMNMMCCCMHAQQRKYFAET